MSNSRFLALASLVCAAALSRVVPHPWNFTPLAAMAVFGGARFEKKWHAALVVFSALVLSDLVLGVYGRMVIVYAAYGILILIGSSIRGRSGAVAPASALLCGSLAFFVITNFGVWAGGTMYPHSISGLFACYAAGLPFFRNALVGDAIFGALLFGAATLLESRFPALRPRTVEAR